MPPTPSPSPASRRKVTRACDACKSKKKACTGTIPCRPCLRARYECTYNASYSRGAVVTPRAPDSHTQSHPSPVQTASTPRSPLPGTSTASTASSKHSQEPNPVLDVAGQYCGPASAHSFLGRAVQNFSHTSQPSIQTAHDLETWSSPVPIFSYGDRKVPDVDRTRFHWPHVSLARDLVQQYFDFAAPTYRVLHQATVDGWVNDIYHPHSLSNPLSAATQATLLTVFATALMFREGPNGCIRDANEDGWRHSELYFTMALSSLAHEVGMPSLRSVQARFLMVLYMLCSSRANQAWFTFGTVVQVMMCLGLHRRRPLDGSSSMHERVARECEKRVLWCAYTLDKYLSLILGRPRLLQDEDIDQDLPAAVNDDDLLQEQPTTNSNTVNKDCIMNAPVLHALLARILSRAASEQYAIQSISDAQQIQAIESLSEAITAWHAQLPPILSGAVQPSSLIPLFRRQLTVLQLARFHALMFVTRPLLLRNYTANLPGCEESYRHYLTTCVVAARDTVTLILSFVKYEQLFPAFWYSQYIAFNALSALYIYLIQIKRGRIPACTDRDLHENTLYELAETTQHHLAQATVRNAPSWRYSAILQGLRGEVNRVLYSEGPSRPGPVNGMEALLSPQTSNAVVYETETMGEGMPIPEGLFGGFATDGDLSLDFWPQLDCLPIAYPDLGLGEGYQ